MSRGSDMSWASLRGPFGVARRSPATDPRRNPWEGVGADRWRVGSRKSRGARGGLGGAVDQLPAPELVERPHVDAELAPRERLAVGVLPAVPDEAAPRHEGRFQREGVASA